VSPGRAGPNNIHLYTLTKTGQPSEVEEMTMLLSQSARGISPIEVKLEKAGVGHYQSIGFDIPFPGKWKLVITARTTEIDSEGFEGTVEIR
jgi:copper transport protein